MIISSLLELCDSLTYRSCRSEEDSVFQVEFGDCPFLTPVRVWDQIRDGACCTLLLVDVATFIHPVIVKVLGHIVANIVRKENNNSLALANFLLLDILNGGPESSTGGSSTHETFLSHQTTSHEIRLLIWCLNPVINVCTVANSGKEIIADTFNRLT